MSKILPSILEDTPEGFASKLAEVFKISDINRIQIDFSDGKFTPRKTMELSDLDALNPAYFWEAHLMVQNPAEYFFDAKIAGFNCVIFHYEAVKDPESIKKMAAEIKALKMSTGLAINPDTDIAVLSEFQSIFDLFLVMGVQPGYQGQAMLPGTLQKIEKLKKQQENVKIEVDGGIKLNNIRELSLAGAEFLNVGSALFGSEDGLTSPLQNYEKLSQEIKT